MTLFFPSSTSNVLINASSSQVGLTVGDIMTITAGDTFTVGGGSTSTITIGPSTSFSLGSAVNISLASTLSYTYGFTAAYGVATKATSVTTSKNALDSYMISAGSTSPVAQAANISSGKQIFYVLLATVVSMGAIALSVVGGLSSPIFIAGPSNSSNPNAVINDSADVTRGVCAIAITTAVVFVTQWALTYFLSKSTAVTPVANILLNSTGIVTSIQSDAANKANASAVPAAASTASLVVPSVETSMSIDTAGVPLLTHRVNEPQIGGASPQYSEVILTTKTINFNSTAKAGTRVTHNTEITLDSGQQIISLIADNAAKTNGGSVIIAKDTVVTNPDGTTTLSSKDAANQNVANVLLDANNKAALSCTDGTLVGSIVATPSKVDIGASGGGNATFNAGGVTISGTKIDLGGALTILGSPKTSNALETMLSQIESANSNQSALQDQISALKLEIETLQKSIGLAQVTAATQTEFLNENLVNATLVKASA